jgi:integrase
VGSVESYETAKGERRYLVRYRTPEHAQKKKGGFKLKSQAELYLSGVNVSKARGEYVDPTESKVTINALGVVWLANKAHLKPSYTRTLDSSWRSHVQPVWGTKSISEIRHSGVQNWVTKLGQDKSATVVKRAYGILAGILDVAVKDRRIMSNPSRGVAMPRSVTKGHVYLSHDEVIRLADASGDHKTLVLTLAYCGIRWAEATGLRVKDVDLEKGRFMISENAVDVGGVIEVGTPKNHKRRSVPTPAFLVELIGEVVHGKKPNDLVFPDKHGFHMRRVRVSTDSRSWFKTALATAGLQTMVLHDLRHTAASLAVQAGGNVKVVQRMLGHASAAMTLDVYADLFDDDLDGVSIALDSAYRAASVPVLCP